MNDNTDRIEKRVVLRASRAKVWRAISNAQEFGAWFGVKLDGEFAAGRPIRGRITNPPGYDHVPFELEIVAVEPERYFSYRWHPYAIDPKVDYSKEPTTLVEFELADADIGCALTIRETGFDKIPAARRAEALRMNGSGWAMQAERIEKYVAGA